MAAVQVGVPVGEELVAVAEKADQKLGFECQGVPPNRVYVKSVTAGGWAERCDVAPGDELVVVDGNETAHMTKDQFASIMRLVRPLELVFVTPPPMPTQPAQLPQPAPPTPPPQWMATDLGMLELHLEVTHGDGKLGLVPHAVPPDRVIMKTVAPGGWGDRHGVRVGDELSHIADKDTMDMSEEEFRDVMMNVRPLKLVFVRLKNAPPPPATTGLQQQYPAQQQPAQQAQHVGQQPQQPAKLPKLQLGNKEYRLLAGPQNWKLGFKTKGKPPKQVMVTKIGPGSWAEHAGVLVDHEIIALNNQLIKSMTHAEYVRITTEVRPMEMIVFGDKPQPKGGAPAEGTSDESDDDDDATSLSSEDVEALKEMIDFHLKDNGKLTERLREIEQEYADHKKRFNSKALEADEAEEKKEAAKATAAAESTPSGAVSKVMVQQLFEELGVLERWLAERALEEEYERDLETRVSPVAEHSFRAGAYRSFAQQYAAGATPVLEDAPGGTPIQQVGLPGDLPFDQEMRRLRVEVELIQSRMRQELPDLGRLQPAGQQQAPAAGTQASGWQPQAHSLRPAVQGEQQQQPALWLI